MLRNLKNQQSNTQRFRLINVLINDNSKVNKAISIKIDRN